MGSTMMQIIVSLISGGVGGNVAGAILKNLSLGPVGNTIVGLIGVDLAASYCQWPGFCKTVARWQTLVVLRSGVAF